MALDISVKLTPTQVQEAITAYLRTHNLKVTKVNFILKTVSDGCGYQDSGTHQEFSGATVEVTPTNGNTPFNSLAAQIDAVEKSEVQR